MGKFNNSIQYITDRPCYRCKNRNEYCHGSCQKYLDYQTKNTAAKIRINYILKEF